MKVCVVGLGYIGLPMAATLASKGHQVVGVDISEKAVAAINAGKTHLEEPGLPELVADCVAKGNLRATDVPVAADIFFLCVPTPFIEENKQADMKYVRAAAKSISGVIKAGDMVVLESTSPVGATRRDVAEEIYTQRPELEGELNIAYCPERAIPGETLREMVENDRSIGGVTPEASAKVAAFYRTFIKGEVIEASAEVTEMVKMVENASRDVQIAFANELHLTCDKLGLNVWDVIKLANHHPRVNILQPGPGVGGHCIAVDPWFIIAASPETTPLMRTAREVNDGKPHWVVQQVVNAVAKVEAAGNKPKIALLGLAYKPNVDDFRESPSITVAREVIKHYPAEAVVVEPYMQTSAEYNLVSLDEALDSCNIIVMLTDHTEFKQINRGQLEGKLLVDTRGTFEG